jgi:pyruvate formate lyase activating enzyme
MTVDQVMEEILRDRLFYETSKGGVTLSGGEPVLQAEFALDLLQRCKDADLHTAIETCGNYNWHNLEKLLPFTDLIMMDIKHVDPFTHSVVCGDTTRRIFANARRIALTDKPIIFRTPIVPTVNDTFEDISSIVKFIRALVELRIQRSNGKNKAPGIQLEFLPFHRLAGDKYRSLGMEYLAKDLDPPAKEKLHEFAKIAEIEGVEVLIQ